MIRQLFATAALALVTVAGAGAAQPPGGQPPNPDTDRDGKVTLSEFKAMDGQRQTRMFTRMDANKDGRITAAEMDAARKRAEAAGRGPPAGAGGAGARSGGFLMRLDANRDGAVSRTEMAAMTEQRFKRADTNSDGWLSRGEVLKMRQGMRGPGGSE